MSSALIWIRGIWVSHGLVRGRSPGERGRRPWIWVKAIGFQLGDSLVDAEMGIGATVSDGLRGSGPFGPDAGTARDRTGGASGLPVVRDGETGPRRRSPTGTPPGTYGYDVEGMVDMPAGRCFGNLFPRIAKGPRTTRLMLGASCPSANVWRRYGRSGFTPKRAPIPALNGRAFGWRARLGQGIGWLAQNPRSRGGPGPRAMVWLSPGCIQDCRPYACRAPQVLRRRIGRNPRPMAIRRPLHRI